MAREGFILPALLSQGGQVPEEGLWEGCLSPVLPGLEAGRVGRWGQGLNFNRSLEPVWLQGCQPGHFLLNPGCRY